MYSHGSYSLRSIIARTLYICYYRQYVIFTTQCQVRTPAQTALTDNSQCAASSTAHLPISPGPCQGQSRSLQYLYSTVESNDTEVLVGSRLRQIKIYEFLNVLNQSLEESSCPS